MGDSLLIGSTRVPMKVGPFTERVYAFPNRAGHDAVGKLRRRRLGDD